LREYHRWIGAALDADDLGGDAVGGNQGAVEDDVREAPPS
jgi:hypothetical protein